MKVKHIGGGDDLKEFNEEFPKHKLVVAGFFAAWCGHCKTFKPEWEKFTKQAETSPIKGLIATIPEEHMKGAKCDQTNFQGFPTVRIFKDRGFEDYSGKRDAKALMDHIKTIVMVQRGGKKKKRRTKRRRRVGKNKKGLKRLQTQYRRFRIAKGDKRFKGTKNLVKWSRPSKSKRGSKRRSRRIYHRRRTHKRRRK